MALSRDDGDVSPEAPRRWMPSIAARTFGRAVLALVAALALVALPLLAQATTVLLLTREELVTRSDLVARVRVGRAVSAESDDGTAIMTRTELTVTQSLKGSMPTTLVLEQLGGTHRGKTQRVPGDATLKPGEDAVVFMKKGDGGRVYLTAMALSVYHVDDKGIASRDLRDLSLVKRQGGKIRHVDQPKERPLPVDRLMSDVVRIAGGK